MKKYVKLVLIIFILLVFFGIHFYNDYRIRHAIIKVELADDLDIEVYSNIKINDLVKSINGKIVNNKKIDTTKLGKNKISFKYINEENIKVEYSFYINVVDNEKPLLKGPKIITLYQNSTVDIYKKFFCGDNYDDTPICEIIGDYSVNEIGTYNLTYKAEDSSGNITNQDFILNIIEKTNVNENNVTNEPTITKFSDILMNYKNEKTKVGIDVSKWQGDIDFNKVKEAGVEFVFIRVGTQAEKNGKYILDDKFIQNIKGFNNVKIPVGVYFFSYADSNQEVKKQAAWTLKQIKKYKVDLPIVFDWENWQNYREYNLSFYHLTQMANTFIEDVEKAGYDGMNYSSKYYLENIWFKTSKNIWLAHYTNETNYEGKYKVWQICDDGIIDGISDNYVDIDIMYD